MFRNKASAILIGTALILGSTACGSNDAPLHDPVTVPSASATPEVQRTDPDLIRFAAVGTAGPSEETFSAEKNFLMTGPESKFSLTSYSTAETLALDGTDVQPAEGEVFHLISYEYRPSTQPVEFSVIVDGKQNPFPADMPANGVLLVSAEKDAEISIESTTGIDKGMVGMKVEPGTGVVQAINAKTAVRISDTMEVWYKNGQGSITNGTLTGNGGTSPYSVTVSTTVQNALRTGHTEAKGWANEGAAFITISVTDIDYEMEKHGSAGEDGLTLMLRDHMGKGYIGEANEDKDEFVFTVPLSEDEFTLHAEVNTGVTMSGNPVGSIDGLVTSEALITF